MSNTDKLIEFWQKDGSNDVRNPATPVFTEFFSSMGRGPFFTGSGMVTRTFELSGSFIGGGWEAVADIDRMARSVDGLTVPRNPTIELLEDADIELTTTDKILKGKITKYEIDDSDPETVTETISMNISAKEIESKTVYGREPFNPKVWETLTWFEKIQKGIRKYF